MADEKKEEAEETEVVKKGPIPPIVAKIAIIGGILVVLGVGSLFLVTEVIAPMMADVDATLAEGDGDGGEDGEEGEGGKKKKKKGDEVPATFVDLGDIIVNPAGTGGRRYLKVQIQLEVGDPDQAISVETAAPKLKDSLIRELTSRTLQELTDPVAKAEMKETLIEEINRMFDDEVVDDLFFTEFVIQ